MRLSEWQVSDRQLPTRPDAAPPPGIRAEEWAATPGAVRVLVTELRQRLVRLEAQLKHPSQNSSKPPSSDPPRARARRSKEPSGRKTGGQPGQTGHQRQCKPERAVDHRIDVRPARCRQCGTFLLGADTAPERPQVTDFPRIIPVVTEYRRHGVWCVACGARTQAAWAATMPAGRFGPRVQATVGSLTGRIGVRQGAVREILATFCQTEGRGGRMMALE